MKQKLILKIILLIAIVGAIIFFLSPNDSATTPEVEENTTTEEVSATNEISYTNSGFKPKEIVVNKGQTVTWTNNSKRGMWVASAMHPTHTVYPETSENDCLGSSFDACTAQPTGETFSFTFNEVGEWGYHDHTQAQNWGRVIVK